MINTRHMRHLALVLSLAATTPVLAEARGQLVFTPYAATAVEQAVARQDRVLLVFTKNGCPVCTQQVGQLAPLLKEPAYRDVRVWQVNVIEQKALAAQYGVTRQSTLVLLDDGKEIARRQGIVARDDLTMFLNTPVPSAM